MIEVFKTNVKDKHQAAMLIEQIHTMFIGYRVNFDLDDCDKIMRVKCTSGIVNASLLIELLNAFGFYAEILPDDLPYSVSQTIRMASLTNN